MKENPLYSLMRFIIMIEMHCWSWEVVILLLWQITSLLEILLRNKGLKALIGNMMEEELQLIERQEMGLKSFKLNASSLNQLSRECQQ